MRHTRGRFANRRTEAVWYARGYAKVNFVVARDLIAWHNQAEELPARDVNGIPRVDKQLK